MQTPLAQLLIDIYNGLNVGDIPVYTMLPSPETPEPFLVVGNHIDDDAPSGRTGEVVTSDIQIDLFYPTLDRLSLENDVYLAKKLIKNSSDRVTRVTSNILTDNSVGRDVFHVVYQVTAFI